ncbi:MAG TPA: D-glycerate dehydrogenase [Solirubrobacteraceae bacterium]
MAHVFVTRRIPGDALERLAAQHDIEVWPGDMPPPREELLAGVAAAEGLLSMLVDKVDSELLDAAPKLRAVANYAIGFDNIDLEATAARDVQVGNTPDVLTDATADLAWALMLATARRIVEGARDAREGRWRTWEPQGWIGADVHGATLAVVGAGRIGQAVAKRASGFDMEVLMVDLGDDLHAALERADFVSIHTPLTPETHHLIDADALARMKPTAILVNTARGPIVDQDALADALREGRLAGAGLDVTDPEPLPPDHPLYETPNLVVVPHIGSATTTARAAMADRAVDNLLAALDGKPMPFAVTPPA